MAETRTQVTVMQVVATDDILALAGITPEPDGTTHCRVMGDTVEVSHTASEEAGTSEPGGGSDVSLAWPVGSIFLSAVATSPATLLGFGTWSAIGAGRFLLGADGSHALGTTGGSDTPAGTVSTPTFTGQSAQSTSSNSAGTPAGSVDAPVFTGTPSQNTSLVSAGTPAGSNSAPSFTGSPLGAHSHGPGTLAPSAHAGTAVQDHASHTHTYTQVPNHVHVERAQGGTTASTTGTHLMTSTATGGSLRSSAASTLDPTGASNPATTNGPGATMTHAVTQPSAHTMSGSSSSDSAGTPAGSVSAPTFTGSPLGTHQHTLTPAGTNSAPGFTGSPLSGHAHTLTPAGTVSQPSFTGAAGLPPYLAIHAWQRTA